MVREVPCCIYDQHHTVHHGKVFKANRFEQIHLVQRFSESTAAGWFLYRFNWDHRSVLANNPASRIKWSQTARSIKYQSGALLSNKEDIPVRWRVHSIYYRYFEPTSLWYQQTCKRCILGRKYHHCDWSLHGCQKTEIWEGSRLWWNPTWNAWRLEKMINSFCLVAKFLEELWRVLREYVAVVHLLLAVKSLYSRSEIYIRVKGVKSEPLTVCVGLTDWIPTRCELSPLLFIVCLYWIASHSRVDECVITLGIVEFW